MKLPKAVNYKFPERPDDEPDQGWKDPEGRFSWRKPYALQWGEWDKWRDDMKARFPVRYFIYESIPDVWDDIWKYGIHRFFKNIKWKILHRYHPKYKYHIVRTRLEPGYYDPDTQMFEAVFGLLCDYVENNTKWEVINWESDEQHSQAWKEMNDLVYWYKEIYPNREDILDAARPEPHISMKKLMGNMDEHDPEVGAYRKYMDFRTEMEAKWKQEEEDQLIRVIKLREFLWYA